MKRTKITLNIIFSLFFLLLTIIKPIQGFTAVIDKNNYQSITQPTSSGNYFSKKKTAIEILQLLSKYQYSKKALVKSTNAFLSQKGLDPQNFMPDYQSLHNGRMKFYDRDNKSHIFNVSNTDISSLSKKFNNNLNYLLAKQNVTLPTNTGVSSLFNALWSLDGTLENTPANQALTVQSFLAFANIFSDFSGGIVDLGLAALDFLNENGVSLSSSVTQTFSTFDKITLVFDIIVSTAIMINNVATNGIHNEYDTFNLVSALFTTGLKLTMLVANAGSVGVAIFGGAAAAQTVASIASYLAVPVTGLSIGISALLGILNENKLKFRLAGAMIKPYTDQPLKEKQRYEYDQKLGRYSLVDQIPFAGQIIKMPPYVEEVNITNKSISYKRGTPSYYYFKHYQSAWSPNSGSNVTVHITDWKYQRQSISTNNKIESFVLPNTGKIHFISENVLTLLGWGVGGSDELSVIQRYLPDAYGIGLFGTYADSLKYINYDDATINVNVDSGITLLSAPPLPRHMDLYNKNNTSKDSASITYNIEYTNKHNDRKQVIAVNKSYNYVINNAKDQLTFLMPENSSFHVNPSNRTIDITIEGIRKKIDLSSHYHNFSIITKLTPGVLGIDQYNKLLFKKGEFFEIQEDEYQKAHGQSANRHLPDLVRKYHLSGIVSYLGRDEIHAWYDVSTQKLFINHFKASGKFIGFIYNKSHQKIGSLAYQADGNKITVVINDSYHILTSNSNTLYRKTLSSKTQSIDCFKNGCSYNNETREQFTLKSLDNKNTTPIEVISIKPQSLTSPNKLTVTYKDHLHYDGRMLGLVLTKQVDLQKHTQSKPQLLKIVDTFDMDHPPKFKQLARTYQSILHGGEVAPLIDNRVMISSPFFAGVYLKQTPNRLYLMPINLKTGQKLDIITVVEDEKSNNHQVKGVLVQHNQHIYFINSYLNLAKSGIGKIINIKNGYSKSAFPGYYPIQPEVSFNTKINPLNIISSVVDPKDEDYIVMRYQDQNRPEALFQMRALFVPEFTRFDVVEDDVVSYDARYTKTNIEQLFPQLIKKDHLRRITPVFYITNGHGYKVTAYLEPKSGKLFYLDTDNMNLLNAELVTVSQNGAYFAKDNDIYYQSGYFLNGNVVISGEHFQGEPQQHHLPKPKKIELDKDLCYVGAFSGFAFYQDKDDNWFGYNPDNNKVYNYNSPNALCKAA